jgi:hypothetical protein
MDNQLASDASQGKPQDQGQESSWEFFIAQEEMHLNQPKKSWLRRAFSEPNAADWIIAAFTFVIAVVGIFQWIVIRGQLSEMRAGGKDTHELAVQAKNQGDASRDLAEAAKLQADRTKDIADRALVQATATNKLAGAAAVQADNSKEMVNAARKANEQADHSFSAQTRPWIGITDVILEVEPGTESSWRTIVSLRMPSAIVRNYGATPAHKVGIYFEASEQAKIYAKWPNNFGPVCTRAEEEGSSTIAMHPSYPESIFPDAKGTAVPYPVNVQKDTWWPDTYVLGCISYQSTFDESWHHTRLVYALPAINGTKTTGPGQLILSNTD